MNNDDFTSNSNFDSELDMIEEAVDNTKSETGINNWSDWDTDIQDGAVDVNMTLSIASSLVKSGKQYKALPYFELLEKQKINSIAYYLFYPICLLQTEQTDKALKILNEGLEQNPSEALLWSLKINLLIDAGKSTEAYVVTEQFLEQFPDQKQVQKELLELAFEKKLFSIAKLLLKQLQKQGESVNKFLFNLYLLEGNTQKSLDLLNEHSEEWEQEDFRFLKAKLYLKLNLDITSAVEALSDCFEKTTDEDRRYEISAYLMFAEIMQNHLERAQKLSNLFVNYKIPHKWFGFGLFATPLVLLLQKENENAAKAYEDSLGLLKMLSLGNPKEYIFWIYRFLLADAMDSADTAELLQRLQAEDTNNADISAAIESYKGNEVNTICTIVGDILLPLWRMIQCQK